ncbi:Hypothetical protein SCF082_LOCUS8380 [Durusdinium trenchii]|uniref:Uncharacterized protein n=1 Tax=Durusdinium trenchii TaxID=1381693 RepID=A0ABP0IQN5_9DINO
MPIQTGANLLGNMLWQTLLGMKYYTKSMRVGTIVLICAVMELSEIGPQEPSEWAPEEIQELMTKPEPGLNTGGGMDWDEEGWRHASGHCMELRHGALYPDLTLWIGASIGKLLGLVKGTVFALVAFLYFLDGVICLGGTVLANGHCDVSLFIPAQLSSQLVVNMITGYLVWGDAKYVAYPTSYLLVTWLHRGDGMSRGFCWFLSPAFLGVFFMRPRGVRQRSWRLQTRGGHASRMGHGVPSLRSTLFASWGSI